MQQSVYTGAGSIEEAGCVYSGALAEADKSARAA